MGEKLEETTDNESTSTWYRAMILFCIPASNVKV